MQQKVSEVSAFQRRSIRTPCIGLIFLHCRNLSQKQKKAFHSLKQCSRKFQKSELSSAGESVLKSDGRYQRHSSSLFNFSINSLKWCTAIFLIMILLLQFNSKNNFQIFKLQRSKGLCQSLCVSVNCCEFLWAFWIFLALWALASLHSLARSLARRRVATLTTEGTW